jgi:hypothetical protein
MLIHLLFSIICLQPTTSKDGQKNTEMATIKRMVEDLQRLNRAAKKEVDSKKTSADKDIAIKKHERIKSEWCLEQNGKNLNFHVIVEDIAVRNKKYFALTTEPVELLNLGGQKLPMEFHSKYRFQLNDEQKEASTVGTKIKVSATIKVFEQRSDPRDLDRVVGLATNAPKTDAMEDKVIELPFLFKVDVGYTTILSFPKSSIVTLSYRFLLDDLKLEVKGKVKQ